MTETPPPLRIAIATDHTAIDERHALVAHLHAAGHAVTDLGFEPGASSRKACDYPDQAALVAREVASGAADFGILLCGTGIGVAMAANKVHGIRAATIGGEYAAEYTRRHNDANVACFGARINSAIAMARMIDIFLATPFDGGRHTARVAKIMALENGAVPAGDVC